MTGPRSEGDGASPGGSQPIKHVVVPVAFTDIDTATGFADLYLLPENEIILATWAVVTIPFDLVDSGAFSISSTQAMSLSGVAGNGVVLSDAIGINEASATSAVDGLIYPGPAAATATLSNLPLVGVVPGGPAVQTILDFASGQTPCTQGTQGHLDFHLTIAVNP